MSDRARRNFMLSEQTHGILERVGNRSQYINRVVAQHAREWTEALAILSAHGWVAAEVLAVCDVLSGEGFAGPSRSGDFIAQELQRALEHDNSFAKREVPASRARRLKQLVEQPAVAYALATVVKEFWLGNEDCREAIRLVRARRALPRQVE